MKTFALAILVLLMPFTTACSKIELPSDDDETDIPIPGPDDPGGEEPQVPGDTLTVEQALQAADEQEVVVKGYIVGYVARGTTLKGLEFGCPTDKANTNMLIASTPEQTDTTKCMPVLLAKGGALSVRENLNLYDHPENLHRPIVIDGWLRDYYGVRGLRVVYEYSWHGEAGDRPFDDDNNQGSGGVDTPGIDPNPQIIPDGR